MDDWAALGETIGLLRAADQALRREAAVALSSWRIAYGPGLPDCHRHIAAAVTDVGCNAAAPWTD